MRLGVILGLLILGFVFPALNVSASNGSINSGFTYLSNRGCFTFWGSTIDSSGGGSFAGLTYFADHINFTSATWGGYGFTNSPESFGLACSSGNVTLTNIQSNQVNVFCAFSGSSCNVFFYYISGAVPTEVDLVANPIIQIVAANFITSTSAYNSATNAIVYQNTSQNYIEIKTFNTGQAISVFYSPAPGGSVGGCGSCGNPNPPGLTTQQGNGNSTTYTNQYITTCSKFPTLQANGLTATTSGCQIISNPSYKFPNPLSGNSTTIGPVAISTNPTAIAIFIILIVVIFGLVLGVLRRGKKKGPVSVNINRI